MDEQRGYDTPEYCFNDYIPDRKAQMTLLICENKDIWFNIRRMMFENNATNIFDTHIDGVVYGCGNKVNRQFNTALRLMPTHVKVGDEEKSATFFTPKIGGLYEKLFAISSAISGRNFGSKRETKCNQGSRKYAQQIFGKRSHNGVKLSYAILRST